MKSSDKKEVRLAMTIKEIDRVAIIKRIVNKEMTQEEAAINMDISPRQVRRLVKLFRRSGEAGLITRHKGGNRAFAKEFRCKVMSKVVEQYHDFKPTFAAEKLLERDDLKINKETLRQWMIEDGLWKGKHRKAARIHQSRHRRSGLGEMIQIDGSHHDWFEGRAPKCCLLVFIDDATSRFMHLRFEDSETTMGYFRGIKSYVLMHGRPLSFYNDKHGIFRVNTAGVTDKLRGTTQLQRAMQELQINVIYAESPQAKGRVERSNQTLQDRLIKEMRLRGISDIEAANAYLPEFIAKYNAQFAVEINNLQDVHLPLGPLEEKLDMILSVHKTRILSNNLEFQYDNMIYKIKRHGTGYSFRKAAVTVCEQTDGVLKVYKGSELLVYEVISKTRHKVEVADRKVVNTIVDKLVLERKRELANLLKNESALNMQGRYGALPQTP